MPTINVNGSPPGQPPQGQGPRATYTGTVQDPGNIYRQRDFEAARKSQARMEASYGKAEQQRSQQQAKEATNTSARLRREESERRKLEGLTRSEIRQREQQLRDDARLTAQARRRQEAQQRAEDQLMRRQQMEAMTRGREEWALRRTYGNMAHRANWNLTPSGFRTMQRQSEVYGERTEAFTRRWGRSPEAGNIGNITRGMGTMGGAFAVQNIARLGAAGQRAGADRSWIELVKVEHNLNRIEKTTRAQLQFARSPAERANVQRQENAILRAREQIAAGKSGNSAMMNAMGGAYGELGALMTNPVVGTVIGAAVTAATAPYALNKLYSGFISMQKPFLDFQVESSRLGRQGGFSGGELAQALLPNYEGVGGKIQQYAPGMSRGARSRNAGMGVQDYLRNLQNYGVAPTSVEDALSTGENIREQYLGNTGLSEQELARYRGLGRSTGAITSAYGPGNKVDIDHNDQMARDSSGRYWEQLQKVMSKATELGLDRSSTLQTMVSLQQSGTALGTNAGGLADLFTRLASTGMPSMRTGQGVISMAGAIDRSSGALGTAENIPGNIIMSQAMSNRPGGAPTDEDGLRRMLGVGKDDWSQNWASTGPQKQAVSNYLSAAKRGDVGSAYQMLGPLMQGHQEAYVSLLQQSPMYQNAPPEIQARMLNTYTGAGMGGALAYQSSMPAGNEIPGGGGAGTRAYLMNRYQKDLGTNVPQSAGLVGSLMGEGLTTGNEKGKAPGTGGWGIAQWTGERRKEYFQWLKEQDRPDNFESQWQFHIGEWRGKYKDVLASVKGETTATGAAAAAYPYEGYASPSTQIPKRQGFAAQAEAEYKTNKDNVQQAMDPLQKFADQQEAEMRAAQYVTYRFDDLAAVVDRVRDSFLRLNSAMQGSRYPGLGEGGSGAGLGPGSVTPLSTPGYFNPSIRLDNRAPVK